MITMTPLRLRERHGKDRVNYDIVEPGPQSGIKFLLDL